MCTHAFSVFALVILAGTSAFVPRAFAQDSIADDVSASQGEPTRALQDEADRDDEDPVPFSDEDPSSSEAATPRRPVTADRDARTPGRIAPQPTRGVTSAALDLDEGASQTTGTNVVPSPPVAYAQGFAAALSLHGELDTNARRIATDPAGDPATKQVVEGDALMRGQLSLAFALARPKQQFQLRFDAGGKMFAALASERMAVGQLQADVDLVITPAIALYGRLFSKARAQTSLARSYTIHRADVGADIVVLDSVSVRASVYGAAFHGVATPQFSSSVAGFGAGAGWRLTGQERVDLSGDVGVRAYPFAYPVDEDGDIYGPRQGRRLDAPLRATVQFSSARLVFLNVNYTLLRNISNSYGESYTRHRVRALVGARLPAEVTLSAQGSLQVTAYDEGVSVGQRLFLADDDESQNVLQIKLSRPLLIGIVAEGRLAFYGNELAREGVRFSRTTLSFGLRADL